MKILFLVFLLCSQTTRADDIFPFPWKGHEVKRGESPIEAAHQACFDKYGEGCEAYCEDPASDPSLSALPLPSAKCGEISSEHKRVCVCPESPCGKAESENTSFDSNHENLNECRY